MKHSKITKEKLKKTGEIASRSFMAVLFVAFGILISAQWRSLPARVTNPVAPYASLKETRSELYKEQADLKSEIKKLQSSITDAQKNSENVTLTKEQLAYLQDKKSKAGLTKLNGSGVIIDLDDSQSVPTSDLSIIHAADLRDIINLLWGSGAEAIVINDQRVVENTAIDCIVNTVLVNNTKLSTPFRIEAIGNQKLMSDQLSNQSLLSDLYNRKKDQGVIFGIGTNDDITVPAFDGSFSTKTAEAPGV
jgi:uncharacterized protein YlxW (UPF0749 family)